MLFAAVKPTDGLMLTAASRGQEFVLDCDDYPEAITWLAELLKLAGSGFR
jgi:hypothetical protein